MVAVRHFFCAALGLTFCMTAAARSISYDDWTANGGTFSGSSATLDPSVLPYGQLPSQVTSLIFNPGASASQYRIITDANLPPADFPFLAKGDAYVWNATDSQGEPNDQEFVLSLTSATSFSLTFNDDAFSCKGDAAAFTLNGTTYRSGSPCSAGMPLGTTDPSCPKCTGYNTSAFTFEVKNGAVQLDGAVPKGWSVVSAPEIDVHSAASGLTLLAGFIAIVLGRRHSRLHKTAR
jgi:hypothetical protein